jgi:opacity protein-like surface antigen
MKITLALVAVLLLIGSMGMAQSLGLNEVGGGVGYVSASLTGASSSGSTTESVGGFVIAVHANLGELAKDLSLVPEIQYWSASKDISGGTWKLSDFAINANVHYNIAMEGAVKPYVGAGLGFNSVSSTVTFPSYTVAGFTFPGLTVSGSDTKIGINLLAGANYKMNDKMTLFLEPRYVLMSDFNHFMIKVGASFAMK